MTSAKLIGDIYGLMTKSYYGHIYGGCVRDDILGIIPNDIDIKVRSMHGLRSCCNFLYTTLTKMGYEVTWKVVSEYWLSGTKYYCDVYRSILNYFLSKSEYSVYHSRITNLLSSTENSNEDNDEYDNKNMLSLIREIDTSQKYILNDDVGIERCCTRLIVFDPNSGDKVNIDINNIGNDIYIVPTYRFVDGVDKREPLNLYDADVNTLYYDTNMNICSDLGHDSTDRIISHILDKKFVVPGKCRVQYRIDKMIEKGFTETDNRDPYTPVPSERMKAINDYIKAIPNKVDDVIKECYPGRSSNS